MASTCDFGDFLDDAICDQLIEKMNNHKIRERLLADENIDLDKAIVVAVKLESAIKDAVWKLKIALTPSVPNP